ncbi:GNAT family N-acetyltransferase [Hazenella coriacea]|uniref:Acetyltransferase (GNAT) family protein n=1 Tax=Hazenella coriacea TaxID=1179467 RepID=A0A4R3L7L1_9BACL|nr:GNAT family N-acetyltransferase [Hazenella coriacea]TCS95941.1 acetyltransferase (GNAT) family protein [Hazenella coriacea]
MSIRVRPYTVHDYDALLLIQREAFPPPFPEELLWSREQIEAHVDTFPAGAMIAEVDGIVAGSATSLIVQYTGEPHTWSEVADEGFIRRSHQTDGDSLYGIDLCVRPVFRGKGVAQALYQARKDLVKQLGLQRFMAGCRIPGYHHVAMERSVEEYIQEVTNGQRKDQVLSFMIRQGLQPLQVLAQYLDDEESCNYAVLVEWNNPNLKGG